MRYFPGLIFLGNGHIAERICKLLHKRLDDAIHASGGLQQSNRGEDELDSIIGPVVGLEKIRENAVRDIAAAILGREITIGEELQYPYDHTPIHEYDEIKRASER
jgi:hypothetical protein